MTRQIATIGLAIAAAAVSTGSRAGLSATSDEVHGVAQSGGRPVVNAVVWLDSHRPAPPSDHKRVVLDQRNLEFSPHVLAVQVGATVEFPNHDRVFHNVFSFKDGKRFDLGMYPVGAVRQVRFDQPGLSRIFCNIHPNMAAYVMAVDTPYFAVSDAQGAFTIAGVEPDTYRYHAWRPGGDEIAGTWTAEPGATLTVNWP